MFSIIHLDDIFAACCQLSNNIRYHNSTVRDVKCGEDKINTRRRAGNRGRHHKGKLAEPRRVRRLLTRNCFTTSQLKV